VCVFTNHIKLLLLWVWSSCSHSLIGSNQPCLWKVSSFEACLRLALWLIVWVCLLLYASVRSTSPNLSHQKGFLLVVWIKIRICQCLLVLWNNWIVTQEWSCRYLRMLITVHIHCWDQPLNSKPFQSTYLYPSERSWSPYSSSSKACQTIILQYYTHLQIH